MIEIFMRKYSVWLTTLIGAAALVMLIVTWETMSMMQKLPAMYLVALVVHEWEELRFPGGFVELATALTGIEIKNIGVAKLGLFVFTLWATVIPFFSCQVGWLVMSTMLIGFLEIFVHLASARVNPKRFYSPGLITAALVQFPVSCFGTCYIVSNGLIGGIDWLWAVLFLFVPLFVTQAAIVKSNGQTYPEFVDNARKALFTKAGREKTRRRQQAQIH